MLNLRDSFFFLAPGDDWFEGMWDMTEHLDKLSLSVVFLI